MNPLKPKAAMSGERFRVLRGCKSEISLGRIIGHVNRPELYIHRYFWSSAFLLPFLFPFPSPPIPSVALPSLF